MLIQFDLQYNGCMWKGGRLRIEKAKEHFFLRLKREWEEDAALATTSAHLPDTEEDAHLATTAAEMINSLRYQKKGSKMDEMQLRMYFPKLGKVNPYFPVLGYDMLPGCNYS